MSPWIHVGSVVRHLGGARVGETLSTRGKVRSLFEKKGKEFVELSRNPLGEATLASYAISGGAIFIRTEEHLYRIGKGSS